MAGTVKINLTRRELTLLLTTFNQGFAFGHPGNEDLEAISNKLADARDKRDRRDEK